MVTENMLSAAVSFHTYSTLKYDIQKIATKMISARQLEKRGKEENYLRFRRRKQNLSPTEKLNLRRERNKVAAQASREKAKLEEDVIKEKLFHLNYEKMKLMLEIEALKEKCCELEVDNECLKYKAQILEKRSIDEGNNVEATIKHAWFVNISLQKEWVLPRIFFILMIAMLEVLKKQSFLILNYLIIYANLYQNVISSLKYLHHQMFPRLVMMHLAVFLLKPLLLNG